MQIWSKSSPEMGLFVKSVHFLYSFIPKLGFLPRIHFCVYHVALGFSEIAPGSSQILVNQGQFSITNCPWIRFSYFKPWLHSLHPLHHCWSCILHVAHHCPFSSLHPWIFSDSVRWNLSVLGGLLLFITAPHVLFCGTILIQFALSYSWMLNFKASPLPHLWILYANGYVFSRSFHVWCCIAVHLRRSSLLHLGYCITPIS